MTTNHDDRIGGDHGASEGSPSDRSVTRRVFFKRTGMGALGIAMAPTVGVGALAVSGATYAQAFSSMDADVGATLVRMARDIFPHDKLPDGPYAAIIASYDQKMPKDAALKSLILGGVKTANGIAMKNFGKPYAQIPGEGERLVVLYAIEQTPFFQKLRGDLVFGLYNNKALFEFFGYEGSSWEKGGYLERGFNDIDWV